MVEIAESAQEGLLALAVGTGLQVMTALFAEDAERLRGPQGRHNPDREGYRHGSKVESVTLGGRRAAVTGRGCGRPMGPVRCACQAMTCSPRPRCSASWP